MSKITMSSYNTTMSWEINHDDVTINDMIEGVVSCLLGLTFHKDTIIKGMKNYIKEYDA